MAAKAKARKSAKPATAALKAAKVEVWAATIVDRAGGTAEKLETLAEAGASLQMLLARRTEPGHGVVFVTPVKGAKATKAAQEAGFGKPGNIHSVRIEGRDRPGLAARIARALGDAGISFRGLSAAAIGTNFISYLACDSAEDAGRAVAILKKL
jgi:hypothetical protein